MTEAQITGLVFIAIGLFSVAGAYFNWNWYMNNYRALFMIRLLGRGGARGFYAVVGIAIAGVGVVQLLG